MNASEVIHQTFEETHAGKLIFPEVVRRLLEVGVESYLCDVVEGSDTVYLSSGKVQREKMKISLPPVAEKFSSSDVVAAIRGAQADQFRYPEFIKRAANAGVIAYWAFLTGKKVIYFGRNGEMHVEEFPRPKS